jgi:hypothetical protein
MVYYAASVGRVVSKRTSDILMLMHFPLSLINSECACQPSCPVERRTTIISVFTFYFLRLYPPLVSCRCPTSGLALRSLLGLVARKLLASGRRATFAPVKGSGADSLAA